MRQPLAEANPTSAAAARDVSVSHWTLARLSRQEGNEADARRHLDASFAILDAFHRAGQPMDPQIRYLHAHLARMLGGPLPRDAAGCGAPLPDELIDHIFRDLAGAAPTRDGIQ